MNFRLFKLIVIIIILSSFTTALCQSDASNPCTDCSRENNIDHDVANNACETLDSLYASGCVIDSLKTPRDVGIKYGKDLLFEMSILNSTGGAVAFQDNPPNWNGDDDYVQNPTITLSCTDDADYRLRDYCFADGLYSTCVKTLEDCPEPLVGDYTICMEYYYVNPDANLSTNNLAEIQCSSMVNGDVSNVPPVWITEGPKDGYYADYNAPYTILRERSDIAAEHGPQNCCGDDAPNSDPFGTIYSDTGRLSVPTNNDPRGGRYLCGQDRNNNYQWLDKNQNTGQVFTIRHGDYDALSTNSSWVICDANEDDCGTDLAIPCSVGLDKGFPHNTNAEVKSSFWQNMGTPHILRKLENQRINFKNQINDYICIDYYTAEEFFECAGPEGITGKNQNAGTYGTTMNTGNVLPIVDNFEGGDNWINEYSASASENQVYVGINNYIVSEGTASLEMNYDYYIDNDDMLIAYTLSLGVGDWAAYMAKEDPTELFLEFDAYFKKNVDMDITIMNDDQTHFSNIWEHIIDYSSDGTELNRWHHIRIPIHNLLNGQSIAEVNKIKFMIWGYWENIEDRLYTRYIDGLTITPKRFCSDYTYDARSNYLWLKELDIEPIKEGGDLYNIFRSLSACEKLSYADYSGIQCCGDDPHEYYNEDTSEINITILANNGVTVGGCWNSRIVENNTRVQPVHYKENGIKEQEQSCQKDTCKYPVSHSIYLNYATDGNQTVVDQEKILAGSVYYPYEVQTAYDIRFEDGQQQTQDPSKNIVVQNISWELMNYEGRFYGCNAHPINSYRNETNQHGDSLADTDMIPDEYNFAQSFVDDWNNPSQGYCQVMGDFYCSFDEGWSERTYCEDTSNNGASISCVDMPPKNRSSIKTSPNILPNGGFENPDSFNQLPIGWNTNVNLSFEWTNGTSKSGTYSLVGHANYSEYAMMYSDYIPVEKNTDYTISGYILSTGNARGRMQAVLFDNTKISAQSLANAILVTGSNEWTLVNFTVNTGSRNYLRVRLYIDNTDDGVVYFDDIQVEKGKNYTEFFNTKQSYSCCPANYCWNGMSQECIEDESDEAAITPVNADENGTGYRCLAGEWTQQKKKYRWDRTDSGYCPISTQCLVDSQGNPDNNNQPSTYIITEPYGHNNQNPQCVDQGQWIEDHFCDEGNWTTRTKLIATTMLEFIDKKYDTYTIFCDNFENSLNYFDYNITGVPIVPNYIGLDPVLGNENCSDADGTLIPCTNNFCVLKYWSDLQPNERQEGILIGTSLNKRIDTDPNPFNNTLHFVPECQAAIVHTPSIENAKFGEYKDCASSYAYYNNVTSSIIYSKLDSQLDIGKRSLTTNIFNMLKNPLDLITNFILQVTLKTKDSNNVPEFNFVKNTQDFAKIYIDRHDDKRIYGIAEERPSENYMSINYENYSADICSLVRRRALYKPGISSTTNAIGGTESKPIVDCQPIIDTASTPQTIKYLVFSENPSAQGIWRDLTSKLRPNSDYDGSAPATYSSAITNSLTIHSPSTITINDPGKFVLEFNGSSSMNDLSSLYWDFDTGNDVIINGKGWSPYITWTYDNVYKKNQTFKARLIGIHKNGSFGYTSAVTINLSKYDTSEPFIISSTPTMDEQGVNIYTPIKLTFNELIDENAAAFILSNNETGAVLPKVIKFYNRSDRSIVEIYPNKPLDREIVHSLRIDSTLLQNLAGTYITEDYNLIFNTTGQIRYSPQVIFASPPGGMSITSPYDCYYTFSEPVKASTVGFTFLTGDYNWSNNYRDLILYNRINCSLNLENRYGNTTAYGHNHITLDMSAPILINYTAKIGTGNTSSAPLRSQDYLVMSFDKIVYWEPPQLQILREEPTSWSTAIAPTPYTSVSGGTQDKLYFDITILNNMDFNGKYNWTLYYQSVKSIVGSYMSTTENGILYYNDSNSPTILIPPASSHFNNEAFEIIFSKWIDVTTMEYNVSCDTNGDGSFEFTSDQTDSVESFDTITNTMNIDSPVGGWPMGSSCVIALDAKTINDYNNYNDYSGTNPTYTTSILDVSAPTVLSIYPPTFTDENWNFSVILNFNKNMDTFSAVVTRYDPATGSSLNLCPTWNVNNKTVDCTISILERIRGTYYLTVTSAKDTDGYSIGAGIEQYFHYLPRNGGITANMIIASDNPLEEANPAHDLNFSWSYSAGAFTDILIGGFGGNRPEYPDLIPPMIIGAGISQTETSVNLYNGGSPFPSGTYTVRIWPEYNCQYCNPVLLCPSSIGGDILCTGDAGDEEVTILGTGSNYTVGNPITIGEAPPTAPTGFTVNGGGAHVLTWDPVATADYYELYYINETSQTMQVLTTTSDITYVNTIPSCNTPSNNVSYFIRAVRGAVQSSPVPSTPTEISCQPIANNPPADPIIDEICPMTINSWTLSLQLNSSNMAQPDPDGDDIQFMILWEGATPEATPSTPIAMNNIIASHPYTTEGVKSVLVWIRDENGADSGTATCQVTVTVTSNPAATYIRNKNGAPIAQTGTTYTIGDTFSYVANVVNYGAGLPVDRTYTHNISTTPIYNSATIGYGNGTYPSGITTLTAGNCGTYEGEYTTDQIELNGGTTSTYYNYTIICP